MVKINITVNWLGKVYPRESEEYSKLIERAYKELGKNEIYKRYLLDAGLKELRHDYGRQEKAETVLTEKEFCDNLIKLRTEIREAKIKENKERIKEMDSVSNKIKEEVKSVLEGIEYIPDVFETGRNTIQIEYEKPNEEYLEFEFYENKVACYSVIKENGKKFEIEFVIEKEEIIGAIEKFFIN